MALLHGGVVLLQASLAGSSDATARQIRYLDMTAGPLAGWFRKASRDMQQAFTDYVDAVKERAEILDGHFNPG